MSACGSWAWWHPEAGYRRFFCGSANCPREKCRVLFWSRRVSLITNLISEYSLTRFFTLTLDRGFVPAKMDAWDYVHGPWSKFRKRLKRRFEGFKFVAVLESHKNTKFPHIHGFTDIWMKQAQWSEIWEKCKGGRVVWIEQVVNPDLSEYVSKQIEVAKYVGKENLVTGYKEKRGHRTLWRSKNCKVKKDLTQGAKWCIVKEGVYDSKGNLTDFFSKRGVWCDSKEEYQREDLETTCGALSH